MASLSISSPSSHSIRKMNEADLDEVCQLIQTEDWFMTSQKLDITFREGIVSYYILEDDENKQIIGALNITPTRPNEASMGNVIIQPGFRGRGLGSFFLKEIFKKYSGTILSWFSEADPFYERLGAQVSGECGMYYETEINRETVNSYCSKNVPEDVVISPFQDHRFEELLEYDKGARGYENRPYLSVVTRTSDHTILAVTEADKRIVGYASSWNDKGVLRFNGLYADDDKIAAVLFRESLNRHSSLEVMKYFTMSNRFLLQLSKFKNEWPHNRMVIGGIPAVIPDTKLYCLTEPDMSY